MVDRAWTTTTNRFEGYRVMKYLGVVRGITVRSPGFGKAFTASFSALNQGAVREYVELCESAREEAFLDMLNHAGAIGGNAVVGVRYESNEIGNQSLSEVLCYGTAVVLGAEEGSAAPV